MNKIKIAFDLDGVIIDKPPLIPKKLIERLFRGGNHNGLHYRYPRSKLEQRIRKISHYYLFRPPIGKNIKFIKSLASENKYDLYIISGRFSFLKKETNIWLEKRKIKDLFRKIYINLDDEQPHLFKEQVLRELKPNVFIDDDWLLADYLAEKISPCKIYCFSLGGGICKKAKLLKKGELEKILK